MSIRSRLAESLLEREPEVAELTRLISLVRTGVSGQAVILDGAAGIGKTRLCEVARELAVAEQLLVFEACGSSLEQGVSFGVVRQLLAEPFERLEPRARRELLSGPASGAAPVLDSSAASQGPEGDAARTMHRSSTTPARTDFTCAR